MTAGSLVVRDLFMIAELVVLPAFVFALWYLVGLRANIEELGGKLVVRVVRPRVKRWKLVWMICAWSAVVVNATFCVYLTAQGQRSSPYELANQATNVLVLLFVIALAASAWNRMFLEIREDGVVCGTSFTAWYSILEWSWADRDSSLRLKLRNKSLTFGLSRGDHEIVASALQKHLGPPDLLVDRGQSKSASLKDRAARDLRRIRLRKQFSLRYLMLITTLLAVNFAWLPLPACVVVAVFIVAVACLVGLTLAEWVVCAAIVLVLIALLMPHATTHHPTRNRRSKSVAPPNSQPTNPSKPNQGIRSELRSEQPIQSVYGNHHSERSNSCQPKTAPIQIDPTTPVPRTVYGTMTHGPSRVSSSRAES